MTTKAKNVYWISSLCESGIRYTNTKSYYSEHEVLKVANERAASLRAIIADEHWGHLANGYSHIVVTRALRTGTSASGYEYTDHADIAKLSVR